MCLGLIHKKHVAVNIKAGICQAFLFQGYQDNYYLQSPFADM